MTLILYQLMGSTADPKYAIGEARLGGYNGMTNIRSLSLFGRNGAALGPVEFFYVVGGTAVPLLDALRRAYPVVLRSHSSGHQGE